MHEKECEQTVCDTTMAKAIKVSGVVYNSRTQKHGTRSNKSAYDELSKFVHELAKEVNLLRSEVASLRAGNAFNVGAIRELAAALGYKLKCDGVDGKETSVVKCQRMVNSDQAGSHVAK